MPNSALDEQRELYDQKYSAGWLFQWPQDKLSRVADLILSTGLPSGSRVLEYGCGRGLFANSLRQKATDLSICGCDISAEAIRQGRGRFPSLQLDVLSSDWISRNTGAFDVIFTHHVLEHVSRMDDTLESITRLLAPGGKVIHILPCANAGSVEYEISRRVQNGRARGANGLFRMDDRDHLRRLTSAELEEMCQKHGLHVETRVFANQLWGGFEYLTGEYVRTIADWVNPKQARRLQDRMWLAAVGAGLLLTTVLRQGPASILDKIRSRKSPPALRDWLMLPFAILLLPISRIVELCLIAARNREWRMNRYATGGSEMYLVFASKSGLKVGHKHTNGIV